MTWVKLDDRFTEHPKVIRLSDAAFRLHVVGLCYAARNGTNGAISAEAAKRMGGKPRHLRELEDVRLWDVAEGGWKIHDFLRYNPTAEKAQDTAEKRAKAGRLGGQRSGERRSRGKQTGSNLLEPGLPGASSKREANANPVPHPLVSTSDEVDTGRRLIDAETGETGYGRALRAWERSGGVATAQLCDRLSTLVDDYGPDDAVRAIEEAASAATNGKPSMNYVFAIAEGARKDGRKPGEKKRSPNGRTQMTLAEVEAELRGETR